MKLYNIRLRVNGDLFTEVRKTDVTAAEIAVLAFLHKGPDCLVECEEAGSVRRPDRAERKRLAALYSYGEMDGNALVRRVLGIDTLPLPQDYIPSEPEAETDTILDGDLDEGDEEIVRTVIAKPIIKAKPAPSRPVPAGNILA